ncbi:cycloartenol Synthase-like, partial [Humulus lupulus]|uniref:cycloartenol Synthase-like n=1 Tax=Humulus lupulus TaxID=3486 RepID=UPI002B407F7F
LLNRYGSWVVCFTYATWFRVKGLVVAGKNYSNCSGVRKACNFLLSKQVESGGWGESYLSCQDKVYSNLEGNRSHLVNTGWAMMALIDAGQAERDAEGYFISSDPKDEVHHVPLGPSAMKVGIDLVRKNDA